jgi:hypothetical protein
MPAEVREWYSMVRSAQVNIDAHPGITRFGVRAERGTYRGAPAPGLSDGQRTPAHAGFAVAVSTLFQGWLTAVALLGAGTGLVYPALIAATGDSVKPLRRAPTIGHFWCWRDSASWGVPFSSAS